MKMFFKNYNIYIIPLLIIYLIINILKSVFNIYSLIFIIVIIYFFYRSNKRLFKKVLYKTLFKNKLIKVNDKFYAAKKSLQSISEINNLINDKVNIEMINYEKYKIEKQLNSSDYNVILFGAGSCGKTSLARALLNNIIGEVSPTMGTTKDIYSYKINIPFLKRNINIIDTPGLFEASKIGEKREEKTIKKAAKSDLILFVVDQDLNKYELYLFQKLSKIGKTIIIALNKCDLRSKQQNEILIKNIYKLTKEYLSKSKIIMTIASPQSIAYVGRNPKRKPILIDNLFNEIFNTLDKNGEELLADNILFQCNKLGVISKEIINQQRFIISKRIINRYSWITSGVVFINPLPAIDLLATSAINVQMIIEISKIYGANLTRDRALELTKSIIGVIAALGIVKGGMGMISNLLTINFTAKFITKSIQSITSAWIIRIVGLSFIKYFEQNQNWGDGGIQDTVQNLYEINKREDILKDFLKEAVQKIKLNDKQALNKKLPPYSHYD